ncbi:hypothetical protein BU26DRAFT_222214 [Trematosphaeria pertusa]|uniref:Mid2 domain-containing protein n=1 Tax=Trematosphaeria pertusa TaxID=390896 RepID=A0A6A6IW28_9PLEO|nr:uncharacterized protein BU26DRAFT_222214 [Trematosphaeria pertusa]KAF2253403.1 hypothetical protein BU26DRAFT_222214 [Trematosphaeria pertusa]
MKSLLQAIILACTAAASAQLNSDVQASVASVLMTAIPPESLQLALTNSASFSAELASLLSAGNTPQWYQDLPSDVKTLLPQLYPATMTAEMTASDDPNSSPARTSAPITSSSTMPSTSQVTATNSPTWVSVGVGYDSTSTTLSTATVQPTASSSQSPATAGSNGALSTGAKVGIGVGIPSVALIAAAGIGAFIIGMRRGKRNTQTAPNAVYDEYVRKNPPPPSNFQSWPAQGMYQQGYGPEYAEMSTTANVPEMQGSAYKNVG